MKSLLDQTRARNIEIFLPSFPLSLEQLSPDSLGECLNSLSENSTLTLDHIVALKRYLEGFCLNNMITSALVGSNLMMRKRRCIRTTRRIRVNFKMQTDS